MRGKRVASLLVALTLAASAAWAQNFGAPVDRYFRLQWETEQARDGSPRVTGYLYNDNVMWAVNVRLLVETLDAAGRTVGKTRDFVNDVPPEGRSYFDVNVPAGGATYRVSVEFFDWLKGGPSG